MKSALVLFSAAVLSVTLSAQSVSDTVSYTGAIVNYTIPACVTSVTIEARGAQGSFNTSSTIQPGNGAIMIGTFAATPGQVLKVLVGQQYSATAGNGGGGGTFVTDMSNAPWIIAGGGGGSSGGTDSPDKHGQAGTTGGTGAAGGGAGGTAGSGGGIGSSGFQAGAGGGLLTNGADGWTAGSGGQAFVNGGAGANVGFGIGGFGGGGNGSGYVVGGGGGGYSGGGSGGNSSSGVGGGGASYNAGTNQNNNGGVNTGNGLVIITYTMGPSVTPSITGTSMLCDGDTVTLTAATVPGAISYNWTVPGSATIVSGQTTSSIVLAAGSASGTVSVTVTDVCGTSVPGTFSYTVNPIPTVSVTSTSTVVCENSSVTMTAGGASSYAWSSGGTDTTETITATANSTYTVTGTDVNGCTASATQMIMVNMNPVIFLGNDTTVCGSIVLDGQIAGATYLWSEGSTTQTITVSVSGPYGVTVTDANGCSGTDNINVSIGGNFTVVGSAAMNFVCVGEPTVMLFGSPAGGTWTGVGVSGSTFEADTAGVGLHTLTYTYTDSLGCSGADSIAINVDLCLGTVAQNVNGGMNVYPNPNNGAFAITFANDANDVVIEITDVQGRVVYTSNESVVNAGSTKQIDLSGEANGLYLIRVTTTNAVSTQRVILQH